MYKHMRTNRRRPPLEPDRLCAGSFSEPLDVSPLAWFFSPVPTDSFTSPESAISISRDFFLPHTAVRPQLGPQLFGQDFAVWVPTRSLDRPADKQVRATSSRSAQSLQELIALCGVSCG